MAVFAYTATEADKAGKTRGRVAAESAAAARAELRARGLRLVSMAPVRAGVTTAGIASRVNASQRVSFLIRELATLLRAGITLSDALASIARQHQGWFALVVRHLQGEVERGRSLADAMRGRPELFDDLTVCMVDVGERSGRLEWVLQELAAHKRRSSMVANKVGAALIYPAIVVAASVGVTLFLMTFVVPRLLESLASSGRPLPLATQVVKAASDGLLMYWWLIALLPVGSAAAWLWLRRDEAALRRLHRTLFRMPIVGDLLRKQAIITLAVTLSTLLRSGVEFTQSVCIVRRATPNPVMREALLKIEESVSSGSDLAPALRATGAFPDTVVQIVDAGQASGKLAELLSELATDYSGHVEIGAQRLVALLEPAVIFALSGFILLIVLAVMMPYLEASDVF